MSTQSTKENQPVKVDGSSLQQGKRWQMKNVRIWWGMHGTIYAIRDTRKEANIEFKHLNISLLKRIKSGQTTHS